MKVLIIGSTGFIGNEVVKQLALKDISLTLLVRNIAKAEPLKALAPSKIDLVTGDLTKVNLGLNEVDKRKVLECDTILHCGGPMDINLSAEIAKQSFLDGSKHLMEIANEIHHKGQLKKIIHTVGYMSPFNDDATVWESIDVFTEVPSVLKGAHPYEQMKFLSDVYIRQEAKKNDIPLAVINLPTVIGDEQTGSPVQLGGFGLFIDIIRKGSLPVIPGGKKYRLPLINSNIIAQFIVNTIFNDSKKEMTYALVSDQEFDHNVKGLMSIISGSMNIKVPKFTVPFGVLKFVMKFGGSKLTGIPESSLDFLTNRTFDNKLTKRDFDPKLVKKIPASNIPLSIAELDYRLTYGDEKIDPFLRKNVRGITLYLLEGKGRPIVLVHGLFSDGTDLFNLGVELNKRTGREIRIIDLPGFGRTPFIKSKKVLDPYINSIQSIKETVPIGSTFIGHSFGAALLMEAFNKKVLTSDDEIILLQPPIRKINFEPPKWISKSLLKHATRKSLRNYFNKKGLLLTNELSSDKFISRVKNSFASPRILNTTLLLNEVLPSMNLKEKQNSSFSVIWGNKDQSYALPLEDNRINQLPFGHYFPISNPEETTDIIMTTLIN